MTKNKSILLFIIFSVQSVLTYGQSSVLASGNWYKVAITADGIYCLTHSDLVSLGINVSAIDPRNISMYGNKSGMLTELNMVPHAGDPKELAIEVKGESDGTFDPGDSIIFYGQSQDVRELDTIKNRFYHVKNIYSDTTFYFLTIKTVPGKRILPIANLTSYTDSTNSFNEFLWHETDSVNLLHSGTRWFGDNLTLANNQLSYNFDLTHAVPNQTLTIDVAYASRSTISNSTSITMNGGSGSIITNFPMVGTSPQDSYVVLKNETLAVLTPSSGTIHFTLSNADSTTISFIDYVDLNFIKILDAYRPQMIFTHLRTIGPGNVTQYNISNATTAHRIWNITDPLNVEEQQFQLTANAIQFNAAHDSLQTYIIFDGHNYLSPVLKGQIPNQNLHAVITGKSLIICADEFLNQANTLAAFHTADGLPTIVASISQIYNEYSTGSQDPVAVRDFIRQIYLGSLAVHDTLQYVLLFGNGSYDYRGRLGFKSSLVPTYESAGSINQTLTYQNEYFFTFMDSIESNTGAPDVAIGRIPARNQSEANVVNRIIQYESANTFGSWRTRLTAVCDDGDYNTHFRQTDTLATRIENYICPVNIDKIYSDAYLINITSNGYNFPGAIADINSNINRGSLVNMYIGHGGYSGWAHENLDTNTIIQANNNNRSPLFIGATSDFNRFDDPQIKSCGQFISTSQNSCGIASLSMTRLSFSTSNFGLQQYLIVHLYEKQNSLYNRIGDIAKFAKQEVWSDPYVNSFCLLGDPAVRLKYPEHDVITTSVNGGPVSSIPDTLIPGGTVQLSGEIHDGTGNVLTNFNGMIEIILFDQKTLHHTLGNNNGTGSINTPQPFYVWDDTLAIMTVSVSGGAFAATLNIPWAIDSGSGIGKISYYATDSITDAWGCYENIVFNNLHAGIVEVPGVKVLVYPNPSTTMIEFIIEGNVDEYYFTLYDDIGQLVRNEKIQSNRYTLLRDNIAAGMYHFRILNKEGKTVKADKVVFE
jgi:hypothetical protein